MDNIPEYYWDYKNNDIKDETEHTAVYGIAVACTWNGIIDTSRSDIQERIKHAINLFKDITGKDGHMIFVGFQT